jgi:hypothetical protein
LRGRTAYALQTSRRLAAVVIPLLLPISCSFGSSERRTADAEALRRAAAVALLENNALVFYTDDGRALATFSLGGRGRESVGGPYLRHHPRSGELVALAHGRAQDVLVAFDLAEGRVVRRLRLPAGIQFRALDVAREGLVVLGGNVGSEREAAEGTAAQSAVLAVVDPRFRRARRTELRSAEVAPGRFGYPDWQVADIAVAADGSAAVVTYHGVNTSGADIVAIRGGDPVRCRGGQATSLGCIGIVHGAVETSLSGFVATLGTPPKLASLDSRGRILARWNVGLPKAHLTEFALAGEAAVTLERCARGGGMSEVRVSDGRARVLHPPAAGPGAIFVPAGAVCGERISAGRGLVVVAKRGIPRGPRGLMFLRRNGRVVKQVRAAAAPLDVLVLR